MKYCRICKIQKEIDCFVKNKALSSGVDSICLDCSRKKVKEWRKGNPKKRAIQATRESKKDYNHNKHLKAKFGITRQEYLDMFNSQLGNCAICGVNQLELTKRLSVDHCHNTGKIRQLLCTYCNSVLGLSKESISILENAISYIRKHND